MKEIFLDNTPFKLFSLVIDELTRHIQREVSWCMQFIDKIVLSDKTRNKLMII